MRDRLAGFFQKIISTIKTHWLISIIFAAFIGWLLQYVLPAKAVDVKNLPHKELTCTLDFSYQMITKRVIDGNLQIFYDGKEVNSPYIYSITIENTGDRSISNEDFKDAFSILFSGSKQIIQARVSRSSNQPITDEVLASADISGNKLTIEDFYLNVGESFTVHIISDGKPDDIVYSSRISDISTLTLRNTPKENRDAKIRGFLYYVVGIMTFTIVIVIVIIVYNRKTTKKLEEYQKRLEEEYFSNRDNSTGTTL